MSNDFFEAARNALENFDKETRRPNVENVILWFLLAKAALWGLFALVEAVRNLSIQLHD